MTLNEYQEAAARTALPTAKTLSYLVPGLAAEAGEVAGVWAKFIRDHGDLTAVNAKLKKELGDTLWFIALIALGIGLKLEDIAQENIAKLASRQSRGVLGGSGDER